MDEFRRASTFDPALAETSRRGHATRLAQGAAAAGTEVVAVLGGDGTLNEVANGLAGSRCALALAAGRVDLNVAIARTIGLPNDPIEATGVLLDALERCAASSGWAWASVNGRYFLFHTGVGFDAAVVEQVERRSGLGTLRGHPLFVYAGVRHLDPPLRPQPALVRGAPHRRHGDRRRLPDHRPQHQPLHVPGQPAAGPGARGHARPGAAAVTVRTMAFGQFPAGHRPGARQRAGDAAQPVGGDSPGRPRGTDRGPTGRCAVPGRRRPPGRRRRAGVPARA